jgi:uncharacterized protein
MPDEAALKKAIPNAIKDLADNLRDLGKEQLAAAVPYLEQQAPLAAHWSLELRDAKARGDDAAQDELERTLEVMAADAVIVLAKAGVKAQTVGENGVATVLKLLGTTLLAAVA